MPLFNPSTGFANPMTTEGDIIIGGVAGVPTRLALGAETDVLTAGAATAAWAAGGGGSGTGIIAHNSYGPAGPTVKNFIGVAAPLVFSAANATIPFTVPANGIVLLQATFVTIMDTDAGDGDQLIITFLDHTTGDVVAPAKMASEIAPVGVGTSLQTVQTVTYFATVSGLTPAANLQYDLAAYSPTPDGTQAIIACDDGLTGANYYGPIELVVFAVPE